MSDAASSRRWFWLLGALTALLHVLGLWFLYVAAVALKQTPTADLGRAASLLKIQLVCWLAASGGWLGLLWWLRGRAIPSLLAVALFGLLMRLPGLGLPVVHSGDVYRYLWDGAVQRAQLSPYAGAPEAPAYDGVRANQLEVVGELGARIVHEPRETHGEWCAHDVVRLRVVEALLEPSDLVRARGRRSLAEPALK